MPALAEYLKSTFDDSLGKVLQPAGLIPGALLVLLHLAFIQPAAKEREVGVAEAYAGLSEAWSVVLVVALVLLVGFLLLSASGAILDTLAGRTWRASLLAERLSERRGKRRAALKQRAKRPPGTDIEDQGELEWRLLTRFAPEGRDCEPTGLGDALAAFDASVHKRYGIRLAALWEPLRASVKSDDAAAAAVTTEKSAVDLMANLTFAGALFAAEAALLFTLWDEPAAVLLATAGLALVWLAYRITITKVLSWCDTIDTVLALYVDDMLVQMGTRKTTSLADRRWLLDRLSEFLLRGGPSDAIFETAEPAKPRVTTSAEINAQVTVRKTRRPVDAGEAAGTHAADREYLLIVSRNAGDGQGSAAGSVLLEDGKVARIDQARMIVGPEPDVLRDESSGGSDALLWQVIALRPGEGRPLRVAVPVWRFCVPEPLVLRVRHVEKARVFNVTVENPTTSAVEGALLHAFHVDGEDGGRLAPLNPGALPEVRRQRGSGWKLPVLASSETLRAAFKLPKDADAA